MRQKPLHQRCITAGAENCDLPSELRRCRNEVGKRRPSETIQSFTSLATRQTDQPHRAASPAPPRAPLNQCPVSPALRCAAAAAAKAVILRLVGARSFSHLLVFQVLLQHHERDFFLASRPSPLGVQTDTPTPCFKSWSRPSCATPARLVTRCAAGTATRPLGDDRGVGHLLGRCLSGT